MVVSVQIHAPAALPPAKEHQNRWGQRGYWTLGQRKALLPVRVGKKTLEGRGRNVTALLCLTLLLMFTSETRENLVKTKMPERIYLVINRLGGSPDP